MQFLTVRDLRSASRRVWSELAREKEMVVTSNGSPVAVLAAVDENKVEETLTALRRARAMLAVDELQRRSVQRGTDGLSDEAIAAEIAVVRRRRGRRRGAAR
jgi:hypothetical protein